jgi:ADP-L-glycero-D-manno-heptose 6-epimerase
MASVAFHAFNQIQQAGKIKLFRSHNPKYKDGEQLRDFIYVKDAVNVLYRFLHNRKNSGIYNLGTGKARTFLALANAVFDSLGREPVIEFIDTPADIRDKYQYFTEAKMEKLRKSECDVQFCSLEDGINDYVKNYLQGKKYL